MCLKTVEHTLQNKCVPTTTMNALNSFDDKKFPPGNCIICPPQ